MRKRILFLLVCIGLNGIGFPVTLKAQGPETRIDPAYNDGPYIFYEGEHVIARWSTAEGLKEDTIKAGQPIRVEAGISDSFDPSYLDVQASFQLSPVSAFKGVDRIAAVSDIHGQYSLLLDLLKAHRIINGAGKWAFGNGHLVVVGDIFDRGDKVTELLWFIHNLEKQAQQAGGKVHYLLGNHEVMALQGDLRYINKKYRYTMARMGRPYDELFGADTYLGRWLRSKPVAISINKTAFVHAGFSEPFLGLGLNFDAINSLFQEKIIGQPEDSILADPLLSYLYSDQGPVWYRGYFEEGFTKLQAQHILSKLKKKHIVVGHTSFSSILPLFGNKIIGIDSSIKMGESGELLLIEKKKLYRGTLNGEKIRLN